MALRSAVPLRFWAHGGCCECQASACPRTRWLWLVAKLTIWSARPQLKVFFDGAVAAPLISFSGVAIFYSRPAVVAYAFAFHFAGLSPGTQDRPCPGGQAPEVVAAA